jgi:hypothetical protein
MPRGRAKVYDLPTIQFGEEVEVNGEVRSVEFKATATSIENDGIGPYEFWGQKRFDRGHDFVGDFAISDLTIEGAEATDGEKKIFGDWLNRAGGGEALSGKIRDTLTENMTEAEPPEREEP